MKAKKGKWRTGNSEDSCEVLNESNQVRIGKDWIVCVCVGECVDVGKGEHECLLKCRCGCVCDMRGIL